MNHTDIYVGMNSKFHTTTIGFKSSDHDDLARCALCSQKFNRHSLILFNGRLICNYCKHDLENNLTFTSNGRGE